MPLDRVGQGLLDGKSAAGGYASANFLLFVIFSPFVVGSEREKNMLKTDPTVWTGAPGSFLRNVIRGTSRH